MTSPERAFNAFRLSAAVLLPGASICFFAHGTSAAELVDDFSAGINPRDWVIEANQPLYSISTAGGAVTLARPAITSGQSFQYAKLTSRLVTTGAFGVQVDFRDAQLTRSGSGGNQVELVVYSGGRNWYAIRSDESSFGESVHAWITGSGGGTFGWQSWAATSGTLLITNSARGRVQFWIDNTLVYEPPNSFGLSPATFALFLVNNNTVDATSVTFDNFRLTADRIIYPSPTLSAAPLSQNGIVLSWTDTPGYALETTADLAATNSWQTITNGIVLTNAQAFFTNTAIEPAAFFRLRQGP